MPKSDLVKTPFRAVVSPKEDFGKITWVREKSPEDIGVSKNRGTPKWMVYKGKPYFLMDDLGVPLFLETSIWKKSTNLCLYS